MAQSIEGWSLIPAPTSGGSLLASAVLPALMHTYVHTDTHLPTKYFKVSLFFFFKVRIKTEDPPQEGACIGSSRALT